MIRADVTNDMACVASIGPISTATLGVEGTAVDTRTYPHGTRFYMVWNIGTMTEGTLTPSAVDCDTSGGTYAQMSEVYGTLAAVPFGSSPSVQIQSVVPTAARPFIKAKLVETVSVTTAVPVSCEIWALKSSAI